MISAPFLHSQKIWAAEGLTHHGVIFIDERTCAPNDFAGIGESLIRIWDEMAAFDWRDRVAFASRASSDRS